MSLPPGLNPLWQHEDDVICNGPTLSSKNAVSGLFLVWRISFRFAPNSYLFANTFATSELWQFQNWHPAVIGYVHSTAEEAWKGVQKSCKRKGRKQNLLRRYSSYMEPLNRGSLGDSCVACVWYAGLTTLLNDGASRSNWQGVKLVWCSFGKHSRKLVECCLSADVYRSSAGQH